MKCFVCGKEINEFDYTSYEWVGEEPIHKSCLPDWKKLCEKIDNASDQEFAEWLCGKRNLIDENI